MPDEHNCYLVSFDTDRIQEYVFATDRLREVRGASLLLDELNQESSWETIKAICPDCKKIFFAGGSGVVLAPSKEDADRIIQEVEELYRQKTGTASITGVSIPVTQADITENFNDCIEIANIKLREKKDHKARRVMARIEPYTQACASCERFPAAIFSSIDQTVICEACNKKREMFRLYCESRNDQVAKELTDIGNVARPPGYIGFIYADGNNFGEQRKKLKNAKQHKVFAHRLDQLIQSLAKNLEVKYPPRQYKTQRVLPHEPLLVGGDDLMVVTAGDFALEAAIDMAEEFQTQWVELQRNSDLSSDDPMTLSIGVVLAHANFPIAAFLRLAKQLLKNAKQRCAEKNYETSAIDFMVVTAAGSGDVKTLREEVLSQESFAYPHIDRLARLTQRPYTLPEAKCLLSHLQKFKRENFPRSQLHFLYEGLFHSYYDAFYRWCKVAGRVKENHRKLMLNFHGDFGGSNGGVPPWRSGVIRKGKHAGKQGYTSALGDLIEIYQFVQPA